MKKTICCILSILAGIVLAIVSAYIPEQKELVHFVGTMFLVGGFIFSEGKRAKQAAEVKADFSSKYMIRLLLYFAAGIILILVSAGANGMEVLLRIARAIGEAMMITALWEFFSYTTIRREE